MTRARRRRPRRTTATVQHLPYVAAHVDGLGEVITRGTWDGIPILTWGWADRRVLATRRQLRAMDLAPGGHDPVAALVFRHRKPGRRTEYSRLWLIERAVPKRVPTTAQLRAVRAALIARRTCTGPCGQVQQRCVSTTSRMCTDCETATNFWPRHAAEHGYSWEESA
jgi:hypothetical protein